MLNQTTFGFISWVPLINNYFYLLREWGVPHNTWVFSASVERKKSKSWVRITFERILYFFSSVKIMLKVVLHSFISTFWERHEKVNQYFMGVCTVWKRKKATEPALKGRDGTIWDDPGGRGGGIERPWRYYDCVKERT